MHSLEGIHLDMVKAVYSGPERRLWELIMGEQIHIGGLNSSRALAERAGIAAGTRGIDLCCCTGAGMRFLVRFCNVAHMTGVDATPEVLELGRQRSGVKDYDGRLRFVLADASATGLEEASADFIWGEDAWCYVENKPALIGEAGRLVKPGGTVAFTDWVLGEVPMSEEEAARLLRFMKFPSLLSVEEYVQLLEDTGLDVIHAADTGRFAPCMDLYVQAVVQQLTYDVLQLVDFDADTMEALAQEMSFMQALAHEGKLLQGMFVAENQGDRR